MRKKIIVAVSGYFNPLHVGHLEMIEKAKKLGDYLVVIINNDYQVKLKGSVPFLNQADRMRIVSALKCVDKVFLSIDKDKTVCRSLAKVKPNIFANGGDRKSLGDVPEYPICQKLNIIMVDGLGKKIRASSELIAKAAGFKSK
jgi:cytidyltransferase-like protein